MPTTHYTNAHGQTNNPQFNTCLAASESESSNSIHDIAIFLVMGQDVTINRELSRHTASQADGEDLTIVTGTRSLTVECKSRRTAYNRHTGAPITPLDIPIEYLHVWPDGSFKGFGWGVSYPETLWALSYAWEVNGHSWVAPWASFQRAMDARFDDWMDQYPTIAANNYDAHGNLKYITLSVCVPIHILMRDVKWSRLVDTRAGRIIAGPEVSHA